jgi:hypothetical protein
VGFDTLRSVVTQAPPNNQSNVHEQLLPIFLTRELLDSFVTVFRTRNPLHTCKYLQLHSSTACAGECICRLEAESRLIGRVVVMFITAPRYN